MLNPNKTKIAGTIGPKCESPEIMLQMLDAGIHITRRNFSHGDFEWHGRTIANLRQTARTAGKRLAVMADLPGPKLRLGELGGAPSDRVSASGPLGNMNRVPRGNWMDFANGNQSFSEEQYPCSRTIVGGPLPPLLIADSLGARGWRAIALAPQRTPSSVRKVPSRFIRLYPTLPLWACNRPAEWIGYAAVPA
jgi:hypothetical protein